MKPKILVIDDEEEYRTILRDTFIDKGYAVTAVPAGIDGLVCAQYDRFDLIVTDMHGPEFINKLRLSSSTTPIIANSGHPDRGA
jgi:DNA-binding response OmpR family regulator